MPYQGYPDGLYLAKQKSRIKPDLIEHYGVIDIGNTLNHPLGIIGMPIVIHQAFPYIRIDPLSNTRRWEIMRKVEKWELKDSIQRIQNAIKNPNYDLLVNNCEHFARYVTTGIKESKQLQGAVGVIALPAFLYLIWKAQKRHNKSHKRKR